MVTSSITYLAFGAALGGCLGLVGIQAADRLPKRAYITHLTTGVRRKNRNVLLVVLTILLGVALAAIASDLPLESRSSVAFRFAVNLTFGAMLLAAAAVDIEHMILPNELTIGGAVLAFATSPFRSLGWRGALYGVLTAVLLSVVPSVLYKKLRGHGGVGLGDAKLLLFAGAWFGFEGTLFVLFGAAVQSALAAVVMKVLRVSFPVPESVKAEIDELRTRARAGDEEAREALADNPMAADEDASSFANMRLPMGPFLVLACFEFLFLRTQILSVASRFLEP